MRMNVRVVYEGTFFIGEFKDIESIRHLKIQVHALTFIRTEDQVFSSTIEGMKLDDGVLFPSPQIARADPLLHLKLTRFYMQWYQGFVRVDNTDEAKERMNLHNSIPRVYSGTIELQGSVNFLETGLSNLFIADSNTHLILQVLVSQAVFQSSEEAESVVLVFFLEEETSFKQVKKLVAQRLVGMPLVDETYFTYKGKLVKDCSTVRVMFGESCYNGLVIMSRVETATIQLVYENKLIPLPDVKLNMKVDKLKRGAQSAIDTALRKVIKRAIKGVFDIKFKIQASSERKLTKEEIIQECQRSLKTRLQEFPNIQEPLADNLHQTIQSTIEMMWADLDPLYSRTIVDTIKCRISELDLLNINTSNLKLFYKDKPLRKNTLIDHNVHDGGIVKLISDDLFLLKVECSNGDSFEIEVAKHYRSSQIKDIIQAVYGLSTEHQELVYNNCSISSYAQMLSELDIRFNSKIYLFYEEVWVCVVYQSTSFLVGCTTTASIQNVKQLILEKQTKRRESCQMSFDDSLVQLIQDEEVFDVDLQQLLCKGEELTEGTLEQNEVEAGATLFLSMRLMGVKVFVEFAWTGQVLTLDIDLNETVLSCKQMICSKSRNEVSTIKLIFQETILHDERTLTSYGVTSQSKILLLPDQVSQ
jgi:hypothetical protein